ncbi:hypothetical protein LguiA_006157 [Lonicera macranthoides]
MSFWPGDFEIQNISMLVGTTTTTVFVAYSYYNEYVGQPTGEDSNVDLEGNNFTVLGDNIYATMMERNGMRVSNRCTSVCYQPVNLTYEGYCSRVGCCRTQIPNGVKILKVTPNTLDKFDYASDFSPRSIAFLTDQD